MQLFGGCAHRPAFGIPWPDPTGRLVVNCTMAEVNEGHRQLASFNDAHLPQGATGDVLMDGIAERDLGPDAVGQPRWLIKARRVYVGRDVVPPGGLTVVSSVKKDCGASLDVGGAYRIYAMNVRGRFYIWEGLVLKL
jgi:hypothetical protein